jgi:hypothetical protein
MPLFDDVFSNGGVEELAHVVDKFAHGYLGLNLHCLNCFFRRLLSLLVLSLRSKQTII